MLLFSWQLRVGKDLRLSGAAVRRAITRNTVLVVASSPGFPHGCVDHVRDIAAVSPLTTTCSVILVCISSGL